MSDENKLDISLLKRFEGLENQDFRIIKTGSKRDSDVGVGQYEIGTFSVFDFEKHGYPGKYGALVWGRAFSDFLRTSPVIKINEHDERSTSFETEGGFYKLEKYPTPRPEPKECHRCNTVTNIKDMQMRMGGLLCPSCNVILYRPIDEEFSNERARRYKEPSENEDEGGSEGS